MLFRSTFEVIIIMVVIAPLQVVVPKEKSFASRGRQ